MSNIRHSNCSRYFCIGFIKCMMYRNYTHFVPGLASRLLWICFVNISIHFVREESNLMQYHATMIKQNFYILHEHLPRLLLVPLCFLLREFLCIGQFVPFILIVCPYISEAASRSELLQSSRHLLSAESDELGFRQTHSRLQELTNQRTRRKRKVGSCQFNGVLMLQKLKAESEYLFFLPQDS